MFTIEEGSEAFATLKAHFANQDTRKVSLAIRETSKQVLIKQNEFMWTLPLYIERRPTEPEPVVEVTGLECSDCGLIVFSIEDARAHEEENSVRVTGSEDLHGGWDTITLDKNLEVKR